VKKLHYTDTLIWDKWQPS